MSAKGRGAKPLKNEFYETPDYTVFSLIKAEPRILHIPTILEPAYGLGAIPFAIEYYKIHKYLSDRVPGTYHGVDIEFRIDSEGCFPPEEFTCEDFNNYFPSSFFNSDKQFDYKLLLTNPPFTLAETYVKRGLLFSKEVILLLRVGFLEGQNRYKRFSQFYKPKKIYQLSQRPKFINGKSDMASYAWFIWDQNHLTNKTELEVLPPWDGNFT